MNLRGGYTMSAGGQVEWLQCAKCGNLSKVDIRKYDIEDDIYIRMKCIKCHNNTAHLRCGEQYEDIYLYYDNTLDQRYYTNTTK
jgi:hypothetical protein